MDRTFFLALPCAVYPTLVAGLVAILARPRPLKPLIGYLLGGMTVSVTIGIVIVGSLRGADAVARPDRPTRPVVDIVAGLVSLTLAWVVWQGHTERFTAWRARRRLVHEANPSWTTRALQRESVVLAFGAGVLLNLPCLWYVAALTDIASADISFGGELVLVVLFNVLMFTLVEASCLLYALNEAGAQRLADATSGWVGRHGRDIVVLMAASVGALLVLNGIAAV